MEVWGVTGLMGAGKSTAVRCLERRGYPVIDADAVARVVVDPSTKAGRQGLQAVVSAFGVHVLATDGNLDRRKLRGIISASVAERDRLERVLHPLIRAEIDAALREWQARGEKIGFVEGSRLVESDFLKRSTGGILVTASEPVRLARVMVRDGVSEESARAVFKLQDEAAMRAACAVTWVNEGDVASLEKQIDAFLAAPPRRQ